ncbi:MAG: hypothetical protein E6J90_41195 [Deltaproteobacteria bacterium]|nr:MAG: hypothetical protein E6J90_41195 [Deltaproteobacteria bacterium]
MTARRLISALCIGLSGLAASATVLAQPSPAPAKKAPRAAPKGKKAPLAPAKDGGSGSGSAAAGSAGSAEGSAVQMTEDPPPSDMSGMAENPDAPRSAIDPETSVLGTQAPAPRVITGFPIEEVLRPITLPQNMSEVSLAPHAVVSPYAGSMALRARYGITRKVQLGLTYVIGAIFDDPSTVESRQGFHPGKAIGLDLTVMLQDWIGVQVGVPIYISPLAVSVTIGAPIKFTFGDKFAIGGLDDFLNIRIDRFAPTFYQELQNATNANDTMTNTIKSQGELRVSLFGIYQYEPDLAFIGRIGIQMEDFATGKTDGCTGECLTTFISAGVRYSPRKYLDLGFSIGFDDLAHGGSFAPAGFLAFRI